MQYLEDVLELIEGIPQEVKTKTNNIAQLDYSVHKEANQVQDDIKEFFSNAPNMKPQEKQANNEKIKAKNRKIIAMHEERYAIATNLRDSMARYVKKLQQEEEKFKCELEADSPGITEILERKSHELDEPLKESQKENRSNNLYMRGPPNLNNAANEWRTTIKKEEPEFNFLPNIPLSPPATSSTYPASIGNNVIAAAASQAIAATQQMKQVRKSLNPISNSFDNLNQGVYSTEISMGNEIAHAAKAALAASALAQESSASNSSCASMSTVFPLKKQKKTKTANLHSSLNSILSRDICSPSPSEDIPSDGVIDPVAENPDWTYDPNEPRYCTCNQVSYGDMVACDNPKCPLEWFHYPCVGITAPPKGKWYCPQCSAVNKRPRK